MAFRPNNNLVEGVLTNTSPGRVVGWVELYREGKPPLHCTINLDGDFHDCIRGRTLHFWNDDPSDMGVDGSLDRLEPGLIDLFDPCQEGKTGDITLNERGDGYIEWYSHANGRVVLSVPRESIEVLGDPVDLTTLPPRRSHPETFDDFMRQIAVAFRKHQKDPNASVTVIDRNGVRSVGEDEAGRN